MSEQAFFPQIEEPYVSEVYRNFSIKGWRLSMQLRVLLGMGLALWLFALTATDISHLLWPALFIIFSVVGWLIVNSAYFKDWHGYVFCALDALLLSLLLFIPAGTASSVDDASGIFYYLPLVALAAFSFSAELCGWAILAGLAGWMGGHLLTGSWQDLSLITTQAVTFALIGVLFTACLAYFRHLVCQQLLAEREYYALLYTELETTKHQEPENAQYTDRLTGLGTRAAFDRDSRLFTNIFAEGRLNDLTIAFIDIENPSHLIKEHGHQEYKRMLRSFAQSSRKKFRSSDMVYRFSSDQFVLLAPGSTILNSDRLRAILQAISDEVVQDGFIGFKASMGISTLAEVDIERKQSLQNLPEIEDNTP